MHDYTRFDQYYESLCGDVRAQPPDMAHSEWAIQSALWFLDSDEAGVSGSASALKILDVGCGQGFMQPVFASRGIEWTGVTIGEDYEIASKTYPGRVRNADMTFLPFEDGEFDLVFARHVLEHSPFPVITLMEWRRVATKALCLVAPSPDYWLWYGQNHYSMTSDIGMEWWLRRAGWMPKTKIVFHSRHDSFLKHLKPYQDALNQKDIYKRSPEAVLKVYPKQNVEFRYVCEASEPVIE